MVADDVNPVVHRPRARCSLVAGDAHAGATYESVARINRRRLLGLIAAASIMPVVEPLLSTPACAATQRDLRFRVLRKGSTIGEHSVTFRAAGDRLVVNTHIEITVKALFLTVYRFKHDAEEIWQAGRLVAVESTTDDDGTQVQVSGRAVEGGFRIHGQDGPFLASAHLLTSNSLWNSRILDADRLIDVQHGGEIGLVVKPLGEVLVEAPQGQVRASRHRIITPHYAGIVFYDNDRRWVKTLIEARGQLIEYAPII